MKSILIVLIYFVILGCESVTHKTTYNNQNSFTSNTPPILTLKGNLNITLKLNQNYKEYGYSATDAEDGDLTSKVKVEGNVDTTKAGTYKLTYKVTDSDGNEVVKNRFVRVTTFAKAMLGALANATVNIYKIDSNGSKILKFTQITSNANNLEDIGTFDTFIDKLEDNSLYLYEVIGGDDWDSNNNGIKDSIYTKNSGKLRAFVTKNELLELKNDFKITLVSELLYESLVKKFKYYFDQNFKTNIDNYAKYILKDDIDGNGEINNLDILKFNPTNDIDKLKAIYKVRFSQNINFIHNNLVPYLNLQNQINNIIVDSSNSFTRDVKINQVKTRAYIADGNAGFSIIDISNPNNLQLIKNINLNSFARGVAVDSNENYAYVTTETKGLAVINLSSYNVNFIDTNNSARAVVLSQDGTKAYVANSSSGIAVIDTANKQIINQIDINSTAYNLTLSPSNKLYVAGGSKVVVIDTSNNQILSSYSRYLDARGIYVNSDESMAYIANGKYGLKVLNIASNYALSQKSYKSTIDIARDVKLNSDESKIYVADTKGNIVIMEFNKYGYLSILNTIPTPYKSYSLLLDNSIAYVANGKNGLSIVDLNNFFNPAILSNQFSRYKDYKISIRDNIAFIAMGKKGVQIVDINNSLRPKEIGYYDTPGFSIDVDTDGNFTYVADGQNGILKLNTSNLNSISIESSFNDNNLFFNRVKVYNNHILATRESKILLLDKNLNLEDSFDTNISSSIQSITINSNKIYLTSGKDGKIFILNINNNSFNLIDTIDIQDYITNIAIDGNTAYITGANGIKVFDLSSKKIVKQIQNSNFSYKLVLSNDKTKAYVANGNGGFAIFDLKSNKQIGYINTIDKAKDIIISNNKAYVVAGIKGLYIIDLDIY